MAVFQETLLKTESQKSKMKAMTKIRWLIILICVAVLGFLVWLALDFGGTFDNPYLSSSDVIALAQAHAVSNPSDEYEKLIGIHLRLTIENKNSGWQAYYRQKGKWSVEFNGQISSEAKAHEARKMLKEIWSLGSEFTDVIELLKAESKESQYIREQIKNNPAARWVVFEDGFKVVYLGAN